MHSKKKIEEDRKRAKEQAEAEAAAAAEAEAAEGSKPGTAKPGTAKPGTSKPGTKAGAKTAGKTADTQEVEVDKEKVWEEELQTLEQKLEALDVEEGKLKKESVVVEGIKKIDLFDESGNPMNLRENGEKYAKDFLAPGGVFDLVSVVDGEGSALTQELIEVSI